MEGKEVKTAFLGEYRHNLDAKNRLIIPARFREVLSPAFYVTRGLDGCLAVYNSDAWQAKMAELAKLPHTRREVRLYIRSITSKAVESELDGQGRLQLPQFLVDIAVGSHNTIALGETTGSGKVGALATSLTHNKCTGHEVPRPQILLGIAIKPSCRHIA